MLGHRALVHYLVTSASLLAPRSWYFEQKCYGTAWLLFFPIQLTWYSYEIVTALVELLLFSLTLQGTSLGRSSYRGLSYARIFWKWTPTPWGAGLMSVAQYHPILSVSRGGKKVQSDLFGNFRARLLKLKRQDRYLLQARSKLMDSCGYHGTYFLLVTSKRLPFILGTVQRRKIDENLCLG